jgi:hypothetical protein
MLNCDYKKNMTNKLLEALEYDKNGDWHAAHNIVQKYDSELACLIHAYLHRKEPDLSNASYWYKRAALPMPECSLEKEWQEIFDEVVKKIGLNETTKL